MDIPVTQISRPWDVKYHIVNTTSEISLACMFHSCTCDGCGAGCDVSKGMAALQDPGQGLHTGRVQDGVIQDINRHAAVVMEGLPADQAQQHTAEDVAQAVRLARQVQSATPFLQLTHTTWIASHCSSMHMVGMSLLA